MNNKSISISTNNKRASDLVDEKISLTNPTSITKFKKLPDPPIFNKTRKNLYSFVIKLRLKLSINQDRYFIEDSKISYKISRLNGDVARTINLFFCNKIFITFENFVSFLKRIYDNACREHTIVIKFKNL